MPTPINAISENQQIALRNLYGQGLSVDRIGDIFNLIMGGDIDVIYMAIESKFPEILKKHFNVDQEQDH